MTLLSWIKNLNSTTPLIRSQIMGFTVVLLTGILVYFMASAFFWSSPRKWAVPDIERHEGDVVVELAGHLKHRGIYYLPAGATLSSLFERAGAPLPLAHPDQTRKLSSGTAVHLDAGGHIRIADMAAAKRLALSLPIDINKATAEDLMLIPGIKKGTAELILTFRQQADGRIENIENLVNIKGIKQNRLQHLKKFLYVEDRPTKESESSK